MNGRVFVTRPIPEVGFDVLREAGLTIEVWSGPEHATPPHEAIVAGVRRCEVLLSLLTEPVDRPVLAASPTLMGVSNYAVGHDNVDLEAATELGIPVGNTPDVLTETTADLTWALLLAVTRNVVTGDAFMRAGRYHRWGPSLLLGRDVSPGGDGKQKTLGIIGYGRIGRAVAQRAVGFDLRVLAWSPGKESAIDGSEHATFAPLEELLAESDFVSIHAPLDDSSHHLIGSEQLALMKPTAYLINTARGPIVDEAALVQALQRGAIAGAGLDVYEREPAMAPGLADLDSVVLLPHLGSATAGTRNEMARIAARNAIAMAAGRPAPCCVNPEVYEGAAWRERMRRNGTAHAASE